MYVLSFKPCTHGFGSHDPSAALFNDGELVFAVEEERYTREKHAGTFPTNAINACLDAEDLSLSDVDRIVLPYIPRHRNKIWKSKWKRAVAEPDSVMDKLGSLNWRLKDTIQSQFFAERAVREKLSEIGTPLPKIEQKSHHECHAASAFYPTDYDEALVLTVDGSGEYDTTVVWKGDETGLTRHKTFENPNSLGHLYGAVTDFLGFRPLNGEGKVMGLAPYGGPNEEIESALRSVIDTTAEYDVTEITGERDMGVGRLERLFGRSAKATPTEFTDWEKDLAYVTQSLLEEIVTNVLRRYVHELDIRTVCLAGGVALNCKLNQVVEQAPFVDELFIQPVANDAGLALGGGFRDDDPVRKSHRCPTPIGGRSTTTTRSRLSSRRPRSTTERATTSPQRRQQNWPTASWSAGSRGDSKWDRVRSATGASSLTPEASIHATESISTSNTGRSGGRSPRRSRRRHSTTTSSTPPPPHT